MKTVYRWDLVAALYSLVHTVIENLSPRMTANTYVRSVGEHE
jgi:hypothetical protein